MTIRLYQRGSWIHLGALPALLVLALVAYQVAIESYLRDLAHTWCD